MKKDIIMSISIALNVILIGFICAVMVIPYTFISCDTDGQCYEVKQRIGDYLLGRD